jgi:predicted dithiol-disulfide oxidoreductase (DUF899 family)
MNMGTKSQLKPARELAINNGVRFPNESEAYRSARNSLLAEEIELRRHIEHVAEQRRALPPGGTLPKDYALVGENGPVDFSGLFGDKPTLAVYSYMYGSKRQQPCPMCTSLLSAWDGEWADIEQRIALAVVARSPIARLSAFKKERGWRHIKIHSDMTGEYTRDYVSADDGQVVSAACGEGCERKTSITLLSLTWA